MGQRRAYSPRDISKMTYKVIEWDGEWEEVFGRPYVYDTWFVMGGSASGKSSFVMQLAKKLCEFGDVLYLSYEEGVSATFKDRLARYKMNEVQGRFRVVTSDSVEELKARLKKRKSAKFVIVDSFQYSEWSYEEAKDLVDSFKRKCFIFISQEYKSQPLGKPAARLKYMAGVKVKVTGYQAWCEGRYIGSAGSVFNVWEDGVIQTSNEV